MPKESEEKAQKSFLSNHLDENIAKIKKEFDGDATLVGRSLENRSHPGVKCHIFYSDGMVNNQYINDNIVGPVTGFSTDTTIPNLIDYLFSKVLQNNELKKTADMDEIVQAIVYGDTVLLAQGCAEAILLNTKGWQTRAISEPESEKVLQGPREGFTEALLMNLSMLRRKLRTSDLKMKYRVFGRETRTKACICWIGRLAKPDILDELNRRLDHFDLDGALDTNYLNEYIRDAPYSMFKTVGRTERPDVVAAKLLEGRVAVFLDGTPQVLTVPYLFIENFQSNDDYYLNFWFSSLNRILRIFAFLLTITIPAIYIALVTCNHEELPTPLLMSIAVARQGVPFPTVLEALIMIFMFEILRETGVRMNTSIGQALSIVGALVIGQAGVEAKIASAPIIIVVATTGITGLLVPRLAVSSIILRTLFLVIAAVLGVFGIVMGMMGLLIYLVGLRSFGLPMFHNPSFKPQRHADTFVRSPWWFMQTRPAGMSNDGKRRTGTGRPKQ